MTRHPAPASLRPASSLRIGMLVGSTSIASGGVSEAVRALALALAALPSVSVEIFAPDDGRVRRDFGAIPVHVSPVRGPASFGFAPGLVSRMIEGDLDVLHVHGLWMYVSVAARRWARATGRPYVVSPHGMLDPWALRNGAARKRLARLLYEDAHLGKAACLHALCQAEADAIRLAGIATPVAVVPNGVALPDRLAPRAPWRQDMREGAKVALFLGRVTPKKRVVELITGFAAATLGDDWHLVVVGPVDDAYRGAVEAAAAAPACRGRVHVVGAAYGEARLSAYAASDLFVLPSLSEGLPMAALEAFAHGIPALLTPQCNLPEAFACGAALPIDTTEDGIADGLRRFAAMVPEERLAMGLQAEHLATHTFDWDEIARQMAGLYLNLKRGQQRSAGLLRALSGRAGLPA